MKFRKKPVIIEAFQWNPLGPTQSYPDWFTQALLKQKVIPVSGTLTVKTLEGDHRADIGDWIIQGVKGELYPCKPDIFTMTYEPAE